MTIAEITTFRFTRERYDQMVNAGILEGQNVELIDGEIVEMSPINNPHVSACTLLAELLRVAFGKGVHIRVQGALAIGDSEPQPDIAVIKGSVQDYKDHPSTAILAVEISDSSVRFDRKTKASLYASAAIPEYWLLNLVDKQLEVHRKPVRDDSNKFGFGYADIRAFRRNEALAPLGAPKAPPIHIADMLPRWLGGQSRDE